MRTSELRFLHMPVVILSRERNERSVSGATVR